MAITRTMSISKILTNLCSIRQNIKMKNTFQYFFFCRLTLFDIVRNVLVVKNF